MTYLPGPGSRSADWRDALRDALRFWEPRRIAYNLVLFLTAAAWVILTWPHFRGALSLEPAGILLVLAVIANICYCAAYVVDIPVQFSPWRNGLQRWRWTLWLAGTLFALLLANYWIADEIYPDAL